MSRIKVSPDDFKPRHARPLMGCPARIGAPDPQPLDSGPQRRNSTDMDADQFPHLSKFSTSNHERAWPCLETTRAVIVPMAWRRRSIHLSRCQDEHHNLNAARHPRMASPRILEHADPQGRAHKVTFRTDRPFPDEGIGYGTTNTAMALPGRSARHLPGRNFEPGACPMASTREPATSRKSSRSKHEGPDGNSACQGHRHVRKQALMGARTRPAASRKILDGAA